MNKLFTFWIKVFLFALFLHLSPSYAKASYFCPDVFEALPEAISLTSMNGTADSPSQNLVRKKLLASIEAHENRVIKELQKMSLSQLILTTSYSIETFVSTDGYLPGCSPDWTARSSEELIANFQQSEKNQSMLHMIVKNLAATETIPAHLQEASGAVTREELVLVEIWETHIFHYHVFKMLEHLLQTTQAKVF